MSSGNYRSRAELRKRPRRHFHYAAMIVTGTKEPPRSCTISDISHSGARLLLETEDELPDLFTLLLTRNGVTRRRCRLIWRDGQNVGVEFMVGQ
jgi:hypothetical protein